MFPPYFQFRFGLKWLSETGSTFQMLVDLSRTIFEVDRRQILVLRVPTRPEVVSSVEMVADEVEYIGSRWLRVHFSGSSEVYIN